ncbi:hypothetical protein Bca52824_019409 [Brassica carinata]|uniref:Uncharacterized protein n=1 Tax=Brassica carinata TaxID=52824 RepID=A0A8X8B0D4_BRACI|nr:hypothetical protein Bca52824_019409 [Brassica carinata]
MGSMDDADQIVHELRGLQEVTRDIDYLKIGWEKLTEEYRTSHVRFTTIKDRLESLGARFNSVDANIQQITQVVSRLEGVYTSD